MLACHRNQTIILLGRIETHSILDGFQHYYFIIHENIRPKKGVFQGKHFKGIFGGTFFLLLFFKCKKKFKIPLFLQIFHLLFLSSKDLAGLLPFSW